MTTPRGPYPSLRMFYVERWEEDRLTWEDWGGAGVGAGPYTVAMDAFHAVERIREMWPPNAEKCFRVVERQIISTQVGEAIGPAGSGSSTPSQAVTE